MKCGICKHSVNELFLGKIEGTYIKDENGKKHVICANCQRTGKSKGEMLSGL